VSDACSGEDECWHGVDGKWWPGFAQPLSGVAGGSRWVGANPS
jgi:hypothetical protein